MRFTELEIPGSYLVEIEPHHDERGFFARTWCAREFAAQGLEDRLVQCSLSFTRRRGTIRGLHYQAAPHAEAKLIHGLRGVMYDVLVDLRRESPAYGRWTATTLAARDRRLIYVPPGVAHGFQALADDTEVLYQMSEAYAPEAQRGIRWNDPALAVAWPCAEVIVSARDRSYPDFVP